MNESKASGARRDTSASRRDTRTRLLDAAERLFAERGIAPTSVRDIVSAAHANLGAITYHFGSKSSLERSVIARRLGPLNDERIALLDAAESEAAVREAGGSPSIEAVLRAILAPTIRLWRENPRFMHMLGRLHDEPDRALQKCAEHAPFFQRAVGAIMRALPELPREELVWRMLFLRGAMIHTWTNAERFAAMTGLAKLNLDDEAIVDRLVQFGAAGLRAAVPQRQRRRARGRTS